MSGLAMVVVFGGAGCGALLRWWLGLMLNAVFPTVPLGTLAANLIGGLLVGLPSAFFTHHTGLAPEWWLLLITGFLGGLTTFSTFSAEGLHLMQRGEWGWLAVHTAAHVAGSLAMAWAGYTLVMSLRG